MSLKHLDHLNLTVKNFNKTASWYENLFDFKVVEKVENDPRRGTWGVIQSGEALLCIYERPEHEFVQPEENLKAHKHTINHFAFRITDSADFEERLEKYGVEEVYGGATQYPHSKSWYVIDPTGYEVEVVCWNEDRINFEGRPH